MRLLILGLRRVRGCPAGRAACAARDHFVVGIPLRLGLPLVGKEDHSDQREEGMR
jgi:hypothetical protein